MAGISERFETGGEKPYNTACFIQTASYGRVVLYESVFLIPSSIASYCFIFAGGTSRLGDPRREEEAGQRKYYVERCRRNVTVKDASRAPDGGRCVTTKENKTVPGAGRGCIS